ncbi:MAG: radical SAM family heme chaperone HemW [Bacillota bacterium]|nr:radical SAM family heme chaperone HemW [Bacillota bacterium]
MMINSTNVGVYIHIPFCVRKCRYCDFLSFPAEESLKKEYVEALCREIRGYSCKGRTADSVFIGGGTPSVLSPELTESIINTVADVFNLSPECEITAEINPGTMDREKTRVYRDCGINRISMGVQSLDDRLLERLGRIHRKKEVYETYNLLREAGFDNINTDLMFSLPGQSIETWDKTLRETVDLKPEHISFYGLIIEAGTPFYDELKSGNLEETEDEQDRLMYRLALERLTAAGYRQYEISNAAFPRRESVHNLKYWSMEDYAGFGIGAHSFEKGMRYCCTTDIKEYLSQYREIPEDRKKFCSIINRNTVKDNAEEFIFTGLRKTAGVLKKDFEKLTGKSIESVYSDEINRMSEEGLLIDSGDRIYLTEKGTDLSNYVMREFIKEEEWKQ